MSKTQKPSSFPGQPKLKPVQDAPEQLATDEGVVMMELDFQLHPDSALQGATKRRAVKVAHALVNYADDDNNGYLDMVESIGLGGTVERAQQLLTAARLTVLTQNAANITNPELKPTVTPQRTLPYTTPIMRSSVAVEDTVLYNSEKASEKLAMDYHIPLKDAAQVIARTLPKGVQEVRLSDLCNVIAELNCVPTTPGKVQVFTQPGKTL
jgi:hypothetical protein